MWCLTFVSASNPCCTIVPPSPFCELLSVHPPPCQVLRLANNSLTGAIPASAATAPALFMLDLRSNKLSGGLPENWATPSLQMLFLDDNKLTGGCGGLGL
jgi:hypothetical protein